MSRWIDASDTDRQQSAYIIATEKNISVGAVEKDWWVTAILKVCSPFLRQSICSSKVEQVSVKAGT